MSRTKPPAKSKVSYPSTAKGVAAAPSEQGPAPSVRREEILTVACDLFYSRGYQAASIRDLGKGVGFTQAALYYHFKSKDEILFALVDGFTEVLRNRLESALQETDDPVEGLRRAVRAHIMLTRTHFREIKLAVEDKKLLGPEFTERVRQREMSIYELYRAHVEKLKSAGLCRPLATPVIVFNILALPNFIFDWYRPERKLQLAEIADQTVEMLSRGLIVEASPPAPKGEAAARTAAPKRGRAA